MQVSLAVLTTAIALSAFPALSGSMTGFVTHVRDGDTVVVGQ